ncbi:hypothetical protein RB601_003656 [Gaeumannomyces tritici]
MGLGFELSPFQGGGASIIAAAFYILLLLAVGITRLWTGWVARSQARCKPDAVSSATAITAKPAPLIPYWLPILGHTPNFVFNHGSFLTGLRDSLPHGVASLNLLGTTHVFIFRHSVGRSLLAKPSSAADAGWLRARLLSKAFGYPSSELDAYIKLSPRLNGLFTRYLLSDPGLTCMVAATAGRLARNINRFVTLGAAEQTVQMEWERVAGVEPVTSIATKNTVAGRVPYSGATSHSSYARSSVEAPLDALVRAFVGFTANPSLLGDDFMENFPNFWDLLQEFDRSWILLALDIPRWVPSFLAPGAAAARAAAARAEMMRYMCELETALDRRAAGQDAGPRWQRLDTVSGLVQARVMLYREMGVSIEARAANDLGLVWAMNTNANMLVFWIVARIAADSALLARVRTEVAPYIGTEGGAANSDRRTVRHIDIEGLCARCPLLKAAYVESLRIDGSSWSFRQARQNLVLTDQHEGDGRLLARWLVPKGAYAHIAEELRHTDPRIFPDPFTWNHGRHITVQEAVGPISSCVDAHASKGKVAVAKMGLVRPYGGGSSTCPGRAFALRETMVFVAAILHQYDIHPVNIKPDGSWVMPAPESSSVGIKRVKRPFRVVIRRRF